MIIRQLGLKFFIYLVGKEIGGGHVEDKQKDRPVEAGPDKEGVMSKPQGDGLGLDRMGSSPFFPEMN